MVSISDISMDHEALLKKGLTNSVKVLVFLEKCKLQFFCIFYLWSLSSLTLNHFYYI